MKRLLLALAVAGLLSLFAAPAMAGGYYSRGRVYRPYYAPRPYYYRAARPYRYYRQPRVYNYYRAPYRYGYPAYRRGYYRPGVSFSFGF